MCNPISRARRKIEGKNFWPALLPNHKIDFSNAGAASVVETKCSDTEDGSSHSSLSSSSSSAAPASPIWEEGVHGVLMEFGSEENWERTEKSEKGYNLKQVWVYPYNEKRGEDQPQASSFLEPILANVFFFAGKVPDCEGIPQERYLKIIAEGMRHHNVCSDYVQNHILSAKCTPVRKPVDYISFPRDPEPLPTISYDDYVKRATTDTPCFLLGGFVVDLASDLPEESAPITKFMKHMFIGKQDIRPFLKEVFYDPDAMNPESGYCFTQDSFCWQRWSENQLTDVFNSSGLKVRVSHILEEQK